MHPPPSACPSAAIPARRLKFPTSSFFFVSTEITGWPAVRCSSAPVDVLGLNLGSNALTGPIPREIGNLSNLTFLGLHDNGLTGPIPAWLGTMTSLTGLVLGDNALSGPLPSELASLSDLADLASLWVPGLELSGPIPSWLSNLTNLRSLNLSDNRLTGTIPTWLGNLTNLQFLRLYANPLTGPLPQTLTQLSLRTFWVHFTQACAPADAAFQAWVATIPFFRGTTCEQDRTGSFPDTLTPGETGVRGNHVTELRQLVNTVRAVCELPRAVWTDRRIVAGETPVKAIHLTELRMALTEAYTACSLTPPTYTDPVIVRGMTPVKAAHWTELRDAGLRGPDRDGSLSERGVPRTGAPRRETGSGQRGAPKSFAVPVPGRPERGLSRPANPIASGNRGRVRDVLPFLRALADAG